MCIRDRDYSGKIEIYLWQEDYARYQHYLEKGNTLYIEGSFKERRYKKDEYDFNINKLQLLDSVKTALTRSLVFELEPELVDDEFLEFISDNVQNNPGNSSIRFNIIDMRQKNRVTMTTENGFSMNDDMIVFLNEHNYLKVSVLTP